MKIKIRRRRLTTPVLWVLLVMRIDERFPDFFGRVLNKIMVITYEGEA